MFPSSLEEVLTTQEEISILVRAIAHSIHDCGGSAVHLNELLADAKGERKHFDRVAKRLVGKAWELTERLVALGSVDFDCSPEEFRSQYPQLKSVGDCSLIGREKVYYSETRPGGVCCYRLVHFPVAARYDEITADAETEGWEYAGWRENVAYTALFANDWERFRHVEIVAPGSMIDLEPYGGSQIVRVPATKVRGEGFEISGYDINRRGIFPLLNLNCFCLIRVPA